MKKTTKDTINIKQHDVTYEHEESLEVGELMPTGRLYVDSMEQIVNMKDTFSQTMESSHRILQR